MRKNKLLVAVFCAFAVLLVCLVSMASAAVTPRQIVDGKLSKWYDNYIPTVPGLSSDELYWPAWDCLSELNELPNPQLGDEVSVVLFSKETPRPINYKVVEITYPNVGKLLVWAADGISSLDPSRMTAELDSVMRKIGDDYDETWSLDERQMISVARVGGFTIYEERDYEETAGGMSSSSLSLSEFVYPGGRLPVDDSACPIYDQTIFGVESDGDGPVSSFGGTTIGVDVGKWNALFDTSANPEPEPDPDPAPAPTDPGSDSGGSDPDPTDPSSDSGSETDPDPTDPADPTPEPDPTSPDLVSDNPGSGGGCNAGFAAGFLLLGACALLKKR